MGGWILPFWAWISLKVRHYTVTSGCVPESPLDPGPPAGVVDEGEELSVVVDVEVAVVRHREPEPHAQPRLRHPGDKDGDKTALSSATEKSHLQDPGKCLLIWP